jgi:serine/threonine protein phosphatase 1
MHHLSLVNFDKQVDRLISVGDLADRGPSSEECVQLIREPWFFAVRGNHEDMCIGVHRGGWPQGNFMSNGGQWFTDLDIFQSRQEQLVELMETLPLFIEVPIGDSVVGVLHADCVVHSWKAYSGVYNEESVIWGRSRIYSKAHDWVHDISVVVVGHTPVKEVQVLGNVVYIDTGAVYGKGLTLIEGKDLLKLVPNETPSKH